MGALTKRSTSAIGARAELAVAGQLARVGFSVWIPFFNAHSRVDLIYVNEQGLARRVQCKSAHFKNEVVMFYTCSHTGGVERAYLGDVDEFGVYSPDLNQVYLVPVEDVPARVGRLRVGATKNNQLVRVLWAKDYELESP